jgi:DNA-binding response OmpR family regulator
MTLEHASLSGKRILIVEDEYFIAQDLRLSFTEAGADVIGPVPSLADALLHFERADGVDAAVLDINLRGETVYPLVDRLAEAGVPMVFVTGYDPSEIPARYRHIVRCEKPLSIGRLVAALRLDPR